MFIGLNKTIQVNNIKATSNIQNLTITRTINIYMIENTDATRKIALERIKNYVLKQMHFV
jgi:hypothetical protein